MGKEIPVEIKVISILTWIFVIPLIFIGLISLVLGIRKYFVDTNIMIWENSILFGIIFLIIGSLIVFTGIGLWKGKNWARITEVIFSILLIVYILFNISSFFLNPSRGDFNYIPIILRLVVIIIPLLIGIYLLFDQKVKKAFS